MYRTVSLPMLKMSARYVSDEYSICYSGLLKKYHGRKSRKRGKNPAEPTDLTDDDIKKERVTSGRKVSLMPSMML